MTEEIRLGHQYEWDAFGEAEARNLDGSTSYGYLTNGELQLSVNDVIEIKYRSLTTYSGKYFVDAETSSSRAYLYMQSTGLLSDNYYLVKVDGVDTYSIPQDEDEHTLELTSPGALYIYQFGRRYTESSHCPISFTSIKLNGVDLDITWVDTVTVGGQSETKAEIEDHFETLTLFDSYVDGLSVAEDYNVQWMARVATDTITSELTFNISMNGNELLLDGENKTTIDDQYGNSIADLISGYGRVINMMGIENSPPINTFKFHGISKKSQTRSVIVSYMIENRKKL